MLSEQEKRIVEFGRDNNQTKEQIMEALQRSRGVTFGTTVGIQPIQPTEPAQKVGFLSAIRSRIGERGARVARGFERQFAREQTPIETGFQLAGETIGGAFDIALEGIKAVGRTVTTEKQEEKIKEIVKERAASIFPDFAESPLGRLIGFGVKEFEELSPRQQDNFRSTLELLTIIPITKVARVGVETTVPVVRETARVGAEIAERRLAEQISRDALIITSPTLSKADKIASLEAGRGEISKLTRDVKLQPSGSDVRVAKSVEDVVKPSNNFVVNIDAIRRKIEKFSEGIGEKLRGNNTIFNKKQVRSKLNETKEDSRVIFGTDKALENNYDTVIDEFIKILDKNPKTLEGLWKTRKEFDIVMKRKFPNVFEKFGGDAVRSNAILDVRRAANDFIAEKLPAGSIFKEELLEISNMFTARKNIAKNAVGLIDVRITDKVMSIIRANPITSFATGGIVTIGALTSLISAPLVLGALFAVGVVKLGQKIFTARILKESLSKGLRTLEKTLKPDEKKAFQDLIDELDKAPRVGK